MMFAEGKGDHTQRFFRQGSTYDVTERLSSLPHETAVSAHALYSQRLLPDSRMTVAHASLHQRAQVVPALTASVLCSGGEMSSGTPVILSPSKSAESSLSGGSSKKRDSLGSAPPHPILKDVGEIYSRLLDHKPVIQGEIRYFIKEFEEKRGFREIRVLENLKNTVSEANDQTLPKCEQVMCDNLNEALRKLQIANEMINRLQQIEQEERQLQTEKLMAGETKRIALWEEFMKEQHNMRAVVDEEHTKAMERLKEQYATMEKGLAKHTF
ncbi:biogenesis of lysosome-related organelles complex 1 subunit 5 isoform X1 [Hemicordylus capensis]|uniref:biogenesis of lysosome-related organelles complex 1 subunit 5 isoform X1 n=1 Tax=Hemicordylus capensis TaxID=884348 RepID=UPI002304C0AF|nr:biogenesis of lysosome-related organelles complex 1 subunit 5 isoform X1 [Hemicordylus capensis]